MDACSVAVIGHGEAGSLIAGGLAKRGFDVTAYDPAPPEAPTVALSASLQEAVADADIVLSINSSTVATRVAEQIAPHLKPNAIYADLNTGTPALKERLATLVPEGSFVDVAVMKPVPGLAELVPMAVAGPAAQRLIDRLAPAGLQLEYVSEQVGQAAARKLTRSILAKCMAGVVIDFMWAADAMGLTDWAYQELLNEFDSISSATAKRYLAGTVTHVKRREIEMLDVVEMLEHAEYHSMFVPPTQLVYNRIYHSIKVPFGTTSEQEQFGQQGTPPAPTSSPDAGW